MTNSVSLVTLMTRWLWVRSPASRSWLCHFHARPLAGLRLDRHAPAEFPRALGHARQSHVAALRR